MTKIKGSSRPPRPLWAVADPLPVRRRQPRLTVRPDGLITTRQAADLCGVHPQTVLTWIYSGILPSSHEGKGQRHLLNIVDVAKAEHATRRQAGRPATTAPAWQLANEPDIDMAAVLTTCLQRAGDAPNKSEPVVYYITFAELIKIGTSSHLWGRMSSLPCDALLATEPGSFALERQRHKEFAEYLSSGEWFRPGARLLGHIAMIAGA